MSEMTIDQPQAVRDGEALDKEKLSAHHQTVFPALGSDIEIQQFPSGFSNLTYWVKMGERKIWCHPVNMGIKASLSKTPCLDFFAANIRNYVIIIMYT